MVSVTGMVFIAVDNLPLKLIVSATERLFPIYHMKSAGSTSVSHRTVTLIPFLWTSRTSGNIEEIMYYDILSVCTSVAVCSHLLYSYSPEAIQ